MRCVNCGCNHEGGEVLCASCKKLAVLMLGQRQVDTMLKSSKFNYLPLSISEKALVDHTIKRALNYKVTIGPPTQEHVADRVRIAVEAVMEELICHFRK